MGPTASGKTALALDWALRLDTEVVSVDSALVYRGLDIGAAKPTREELDRVRHHLIDVREPHEIFSAADFAREALPPMQALAARGRVPLLVGGTGLYFSALLDGLSELPAADPALRAAIAAEGAGRGWAALHAEMAAVDPAAGRRIQPRDVQRISRALEVYRLTGRPISAWQAEHAPARFPFRVLKLVLAPADRAVLHERIARRFDLMLAAGFLDEVRRLKADPRLHPDLPSMRAVGYRQAWRHLAGATDAAGFRDEAIAATRQLAKRQLTWLRGQLDARWFDPARDATALHAAMDAFIARR
ncbi:MAG TPA: tRNA (adenosine(37)-N6)-dimethylallyltransferase MiaA [Arenimonas sp.]|uniref:tRNA (adenosine(37)-N6)-dimethylallyltransferase MiaA n=1 Tax=Arenimonas sp. TaxID=1872635 RepID=UPI002D7F0F72|nr:tRNA (adenosine(37)-N6)-dimethylallyltransferase MiaA [Arenimonas sp.]HEU0153368.1 tRNA (adenosine(37)-N6)-dimethylallyltransferase MiaA [Arenimonas sp.]